MRYTETGTLEQLVNTAPPHMPELHLHKFSLLTSGQQQSRTALRTSILWMFQDHQVNSLNQNGDEMMCRSGILVEHYLCLILNKVLMHRKVGR